MAAIKWNVRAGVVALSTGLNSLANNGQANSADIDNTSNLDEYLAVQLHVKYTGSTPAAGTKAADIYLVPEVDGANYPDLTVNPQKILLVTSLEARNPSTSAFEELVADGIPLGPFHFKLVLVNTSGQTYAASGNTLTYVTYQLQTV